MKQSKYTHFNYWINKVENEENMWEGLFEGKPINKGSLIISPVILNSYKNQKEDAYVVYPNAESVLGFLIHIYLPTAFSGVFNHKSEDYIIGDDLDEFFREEKINNPTKVELIKHMESLYNEAYSLRECSADVLLDDLLEWADKFNEDWLGENGIELTFNIFTSPGELVNEIIKVYEEDLDIAMLEEDLGVSNEEFIQLAGEDLYTNEFMNRKFVDILTYRLMFTF